MNSFVYLVRAERGEDQDQLSRQRDLTQVSGLTSLLKLLSREAYVHMNTETISKLSENFKLSLHKTRNTWTHFFHGCMLG